MELWKVKKYPSFTYVSLYNNDLSCNFKGVQSTYTCCLIEMFVQRAFMTLKLLSALFPHVCFQLLFANLDTFLEQNW